MTDDRILLYAAIEWVEEHTPDPLAFAKALARIGIDNAWIEAELEAVGCDEEEIEEIIKII